jgi:hypothetical protein
METPPHSCAARAKGVPSAFFFTPQKKETEPGRRPANAGWGGDTACFPAGPPRRVGTQRERSFLGRLGAVWRR